MKNQAKFHVLFAVMTLLLATFGPKGSGYADEPSSLERAWSGVEEAIAADDFPRTHEAVERLVAARDNAGYVALEDRSAVLLELARHRMARGERDAARFYLTHARQLSPISIATQIRAFPIARELSEPVVELLLNLVASVLASPNALVALFDALVYPALWACTAAALVTLVVLILVHCAEVLRAVALRITPRFRGFVAPVVVAALVVVPMFGGPAWALIAWSTLLLWLSPRYRWLTFTAGAILVTWGCAIPFRETIALWLEDPRVVALIRVVNGSYREGDAEQVSALAYHRPDDGAVQFMYAVTLRKAAEWEAAERTLIIAEGLLGSQPYTVAERGILKFSRGDVEGSWKDLESAERMGLAQPELFYNLSRVAFERTDVEASRRYYQRALQLDPVKTELLHGVEAKVEAARGARALADVPLPFTKLFFAAAAPEMSLSNRFDDVGAALAVGGAPMSLNLVGFCLIGAALLFGAERRKRRACTFYQEYQIPRPMVGLFRLVPGVSWSLSGSPLRGLALTSVTLALCWPLLRWPSGIAGLFEVIPGIQGGYVLVVTVWSVTIVASGMLADQGESNAVRDD